MALDTEYLEQEANHTAQRIVVNHEERIKALERTVAFLVAGSLFVGFGLGLLLGLWMRG